MKTIFALALVAGLTFPAVAQESSVTVGQIASGNRTVRILIMEYKGIKHPVLSIRDPVYSSQITLDGSRLDELKALVDLAIVKRNEILQAAPSN